MRLFLLPLLMGTMVGLGACNTVPDIEETEIVVIPPETIETCIEVSALKRVVIPAKEEVYYGITSIDNPPYAPIERKEKLTRIVEPEQVIYVDSEGVEVTDICPHEGDDVGAEDAMDEVAPDEIMAPEG